MSADSGSASPVVTVVALLAVGLPLAYLGGSPLVAHVQETTGAEAVDAVVVSAEVTRSAAGDESGAWHYHPSITYRYSYDGREYTSDRVFSAGAEPDARRRAESIVADHPPGETVTAYVLPGDPETAYLVRGGVPVLRLTFGLLGALLALAGAKGAVDLARGVDPSAGAR